MFLTNLAEVSPPFMTSPQTDSQTLSGISCFLKGKDNNLRGRETFS